MDKFTKQFMAMKGHKNQDMFYGRHQPSGEGPELMSWLARTRRAQSPLVSFSGYAAPKLGFMVHDAFTRAGLLLSNESIINPAAYFVLSSAVDSSD